MSFLPLVFLVVVFYFLLIRPQQKKAKQHQALLASLKKGDKVVTNGGIVGPISKIVNEQEVVIEIADKVFVKFLKAAISSVITNQIASNKLTPPLENDDENKPTEENEKTEAKRTSPRMGTPRKKVVRKKGIER